MGDEADADWQEGLVEMGYELVADPDPVSTAKKVRDLLFAEGRASFRCGILKIPPYKDQDMRKDWFDGWRFEAERSMSVTIQNPLFDFRSVVVPTDLAPSILHRDFVSEILKSRYTELEKHVLCFRECGVDLGRMNIVDSRDYSTSTLMASQDSNGG